MSAADRIAHCAMLLDQCRSLEEYGQLELAQDRAKRAHAEAVAATHEYDAPGRDGQLAEVLAAARAMLVHLHIRISELPPAPV